MAARFRHLTLGQIERLEAAANLLVSPESRDLFLRDAECGLAQAASQPPDDAALDDVLRRLLHVNIYADARDALRRR